MQEPVRELVTDVNANRVVHRKEYEILGSKEPPKAQTGLFPKYSKTINKYCRGNLLHFGFPSESTVDELEDVKHIETWKEFISKQDGSREQTCGEGGTPLKSEFHRKSMITGWWFQTCFICHHIWDNPFH